MTLIPSEQEKLGTPCHIAIIMDGNRRWAKKHCLPIAAGHSAGVRAVYKAVKSCIKLGIKYLTLYAFSTENWARSKSEIDTLMSLLEKTAGEYTNSLKAANVQLMLSGRIEALPEKTKSVLFSAKEKLKSNTGLVLNLALNYGGRQEILDAVNKALSKGIKQIDERSFSALLYTCPLPDPDLLIRTSGEQRLSNFLLWQTAYTEFYVTNTLWPDFGEAAMLKALASYNKRNIRRGI